MWMATLGIISRSRSSVSRREVMASFSFISTRPATDSGLSIHVEQIMPP